MSNVILTPKTVGDIVGKFFIPSYQRGYRWGKEQVSRLLDDISENGATEYCLQPIVVKALGDDTYELIDGQQRLTSIYILLNYYKTAFQPRANVKFSIEYETRKQSETYLETMNEELKDTNIDFFHMYGAYCTIREWFDKQNDAVVAANDIYGYLNKNVKVIWYEVGSENVDETELFTRLNVGKIPLTNAELVKALFLSQDNGIDDQKQIEISTSWDAIEKELHSDEFWAFITNKSTVDYPNRIELIFDMIAGKTRKRESKGTQDQYFTFHYFQQQISGSDNKKNKIKDLWSSIQGYYMQLREWFEDRDSYHKIGYLIAIGKPLTEIIAESHGRRKSDFAKGLDESIKKYLSLTKDGLLELSYEKANDKLTMQNALLLFNIETIRKRSNKQEKFSFNGYKRQGWSLEHIHAQNSEISSKKEDWQEWLSLHKEALAAVKDSIRNNDTADLDVLIADIDVQYNNITRDQFTQLYHRVIALLTENSDESKDYLHSLSNMALLSFDHNAALNNSAFDVKRNKILAIDKAGGFIPPCTRNVFLKYYTDSHSHTLHFWGDADRKAYTEAMVGNNGLLNNYLQ